MGPSRSKRARTKPPLDQQLASPLVDSTREVEAEADSSTKAEPLTPLPKLSEEESTTGGNSNSKPTKAGSTTKKQQLKSKGSWYGTWPRKSTASTQVARESILADKPTNGSSADLSRFETKKIPMTATRPPSMYLGKSKETLDVTMGGTLEAANAVAKVDPPEAALDKGKPSVENKEVANSNEAEITPSRPVSISDAAPQRPSTSSGWLGSWLSRPTPPPTQAVSECQGNTSSPTAHVPPERAEQETSKANQEGDPEPQVTGGPSTAALSWFGLWSTAAPSAAVDVTKDEIPVRTGENSQEMVMDDNTTNDQPGTAMKPSAGTSWAFWSTDSKKQIGSPAMGELAVAGERSQNQPEPAKMAPAVSNVSKDSKNTIPGKRSRPLSSEAEAIPQTLVEQAGTKVSTSQSSPSAKIPAPNLLLPSVKSTYRLMENPSILQQITQIILRGQQKPVRHVFLVKDPPKIKKALAIGIHGLFPAQLLRAVIGQPTGTSIRFANHAADAIRRWAVKHGDIDCDIEKVALEGEGKIGDRVDNLWKLLLNWIDHVRKADFILVACHSQGVPVAIMLVAKLIEFGVVTIGKIGVCAMAGVSLGPFPDYKSRLLSGSAGELFEFADPESVVSKRYEDSLRVAVKYGVKITYCGSIDDQLVSMESSIFSPVSHPYIFRAVFVDGRIHAPNFLSHLVGFALKLRNLGVSDHGLIRELSAPLAGSLYTGEGHSRLYDDGNVYDLAIEYALKTTTVGDVPLDIKKYEVPTNANPYILPWIMRGLLEEDFVKTELDHETTELLKEFDDWKPSTKVLKDVKYRLEAVRSKL